MNFNGLKSKACSAGTAIMLSLAICSCNNEDAANSSTTGSSMDTSMNAANNGSTVQGTTTIGSDSATRPAGDTFAVRTARRRGKVSTTTISDDPNTQITMDKRGYYNRTDIAPAFTGGQSGLEGFINSSLTYPQQAIDNDVEGTVRVQFAVDEKGNVSEVSTLGNKLGYGLEEEAVKVVSTMPKWTAGKVKGKNVKTWRILPVIYKLED